MTEPTPTPDLTAALRLRQEPKPVLRLSRKALTIMGIVSGAAIGGALMLALSPPAKPTSAPPEPAPPAKRPAGNDRLNQLPKTYSDVPVLGPPLPGDLGKPMLNSGMVDTAPAGDGPNASTFSPPPPAPVQGTESAGRDAQVAVRASSVFAPGQAHQSLEQSPIQGNMPSLDFSTFLPPQPSVTRSFQERQIDFVRAATDRTIVSNERLIDPASPYLVQAGSVLPAALITGIRSDLPGQVVAQITQDVYDTFGRGFLLIPQGARLIGEYDNAVAFGQSRVLLSWKRLILPNGKSLILENLQAADVSGHAGLQDRTDYHWNSMLGAAAISTVLSVGAEAGASDQDSEIVRAIREGASDSVNRTGQRIVERQLNISPTLTISPGFRVRVILSRDLVLEPYGA